MICGRKNPQKLDTQKIALIILKFETCDLIGFYHTVMYPKGEERMANSVDTDQTAPSAAV